MTTTTTHPVLGVLAALDADHQRLHERIGREGTAPLHVGYGVGEVREKIVDLGLANTPSAARTLIAEAEAEGIVALYGEGSARKVADAQRFAEAQARLRYEDDRTKRAISALGAKTGLPGHVSTSVYGRNAITISVEVAEMLAGIETPELPEIVNAEVEMNTTGVPFK